LKTLTVPKMELCGAELLSRLIAEVTGASAFEGKFYCWSDSAVALSWIRDEPSRFNIFVANRVAAIQELTESVEWRYVPGCDVAQPGHLERLKIAVSSANVDVVSCSFVGISAVCRRKRVGPSAFPCGTPALIL